MAVVSDQGVGQTGLYYVLNMCFLSVTDPECPHPTEICPTTFQEASALDSYRFFSVPKGLKHILFFENEVAPESLVMIAVRVCTCIQILPLQAHCSLIPELLGRHILQCDNFYSRWLLPNISEKYFYQIHRQP